MEEGYREVVRVTAVSVVVTVVPTAVVVVAGFWLEGALEDEEEKGVKLQVGLAAQTTERALVVPGGSVVVVVLEMLRSDAAVDGVMIS